MTSFFDSPFFDAALSLPTVVFTVLLIPVAFYWLLSILGLFSLDWMDSADGMLDGAADGMVDGMADGLADGMADGLADGMAEGALDGVADGLDGIDGGDLGHHDYGFGHIPKTLVGSLLIGFGWIFSLLGSLYVPGFQTLATGGILMVILLVILTFGLAFGATAIALRPVSRALVATLGPTRRDLVGRVCIVKTTRVDHGFGQAEADDGQLIQVRARDEQAFRFGQRVLIYDYDPREEVFYISDFDEALSVPKGL